MAPKSAVVERTNILSFMGNTPIHEITSSEIRPAGAARIYIKLEAFNPGESIKARAALNMILDAERLGRLRPGGGQTIIEPTGGNMGTGLAMAAAQRGYNLCLVVPDNYASPFRLRVLERQGARVIIADHRKGNDAHIQVVADLTARDSSYVWLDQFSNAANPGAHYQTTGPEILKAVPAVNAFVAGIGSGGTITGIGTYLKERNPRVRVIGVQPSGTDVLKGTAVPHRIQGLGIGFMPKIFNPAVVDSVVSVTFEQAVEIIWTLARTEGIYIGISSGASLAGAIAVAKTMDPNEAVVTVAPDSAKNYPDVLFNMEVPV